MPPAQSVVRRISLLFRRCLGSVVRRLLALFDCSWAVWRGFESEDSGFSYLRCLRGARARFSSASLRPCTPSGPRPHDRPEARCLLLALLFSARSIPKPSQNHPKATQKPSPNRPKTTPKPPQNHPKTIPKSSQNHPKTVPKPSQNHPKIIPKPSQNHPKIILKSPPNSSKNHPKTIQKSFKRLYKSRFPFLEFQ